LICSKPKNTYTPVVKIAYMYMCI